MWKHLNYLLIQNERGQRKHLYWAMHFQFLPVVSSLASGLPIYQWCYSWLSQKCDGCYYTGCIFSSSKHLFVIVLHLLNHSVCCFELQAPHFYPPSTPCNFRKNARSTESWERFNSEPKTCGFSLHCPTTSLPWACFKQGNVSGARLPMQAAQNKSWCFEAS